MRVPTHTPITEAASSAERGDGGTSLQAEMEVLRTSDRPERLTVRSVLKDAYREIVSLDSPVLYTGRALTLHPGRLIRRYLAGERARLVSPIKYALLSLTLLVLLAQVQRTVLPPAVVLGWDTARTNAFYAAQDLRAYVLLLVLIPVSLSQWLLFRREGFNIAETYAFNAYVFGHLVWLGIVANALSAVLPPLPLLYTALTVVFELWAICGFYQRLSPSVILRGLAVFGVYRLGMLTVLQATILYLAR